MTYEDQQLVEAVKVLAEGYAKMGRDDDCVRLTAEQARRLARLAEMGLCAGDSR